MSLELTGRVLVPGLAMGPLQLLEPISFWGGFDPQSGAIVEPSHPQVGIELTGRIVALWRSRGSSSSSSVLAEAFRLGTAPAGFLFREDEAILALGALVSDALYGRACPMVVLHEADWQQLIELKTAAGTWIRCDAMTNPGRIRVMTANPEFSDAAT